MRRLALPRETVTWIGIGWRGLWTLVLREVLRAYKFKSEIFLGPIFSSLMYFTAFYFALGDVRDAPEGVDTLSFMLPGLILMAAAMRSAEGPGFSLTFDKLEGIVTDLLVAPVSAFELVVSYAVSGAVMGIFTGAMVLAISTLFWPLPMTGMVWVVVFGVLGCTLLALIGLIGGIWSEKWDHFSAVHTFGLMPVMFLSGVFAPVSSMPEVVAVVAKATPIYYMIDGFRYGLLGVGEQSPWLSLMVVSVATVLLLVVAYRLVLRGYKIKS